MNTRLTPFGRERLVIASPNEYDGRYFDSLEWYMRDEGFREFHKFTFYRRK